MPISPESRTEVAGQLTAWSAPGALLHSDSTESTHHRYPSTDLARARFHRATIEWYLERQQPPRDGRSAIISAGPPGSGKTTMLRNRIPDIGNYRTIDADIIKDRIIERALADGIYNHLLAGNRLADGHPVAPRELSALVHTESVRLADQLRKICVERKENLVIEGTLTWKEQGPTIFRQLADNEYVEIEVYGIDIDRAQAHEQALDRWWTRRVEWAAGRDVLGGRFTPADAINICYPVTGGESVCTTNAKAFINTAIQAGEIPNVHVTILRAVAGPLEVVYDRAYRQ